MPNAQLAANPQGVDSVVTDEGAIATVVNDKGYTLLILAAERRHEAAVRVLLAAGADTEAGIHTPMAGRSAPVLATATRRSCMR